MFDGYFLWYLFDKFWLQGNDENTVHLSHNGHIWEFVKKKKRKKEDKENITYTKNLHHKKCLLNYQCKHNLAHILNCFKRKTYSVSDFW